MGTSGSVAGRLRMHAGKRPSWTAEVPLGAAGIRGARIERYRVCGKLRTVLNQQLPAGCGNEGARDDLGTAVRCTQATFSPSECGGADHTIKRPPLSPD